MIQKKRIYPAPSKSDLICLSHRPVRPMVLRLVMAAKPSQNQPVKTHPKFGRARFNVSRVLTLDRPSLDRPGPILIH
jgi:hypothetical protein